jgi:rhodanese-related sulfurtransferase
MSIFGKREKTKIGKQDAVKMISDNEAVAVDVRTPSEYASGHIKDAVLLPLDRLSIDAKKILPDKDALIFVYCLSGSRSGLAAKMLTKMGYADVHNFGGVGSWPYELVK